MASLAHLAQRLRAHETTAVALAEHALASDELGAFRTRDADHTLALARAADAAFAAGVDAGPLQGLPVSLKDLYGVPGFPTYAGTARRLGATFESAGPLVRRLLAQLAVVTGKTHTVELAFGGIGTSPHYDAPINPWSEAGAAAESLRVPGGSSSGAGVSLVEGSSLLAFGTDTAGSVRIPAAWTGTCALKTTGTLERKRWSTEGIVPLSHSLDTAGLLARTVEDLVFAFAALDPHARALPTVSLAGLRIGRCERLFFDDLEPGIGEAVDAAIDMLVSLGARVIELDLPALDEVHELFLVGGPVPPELARWIDRELSADAVEALDPNVAARLAQARSMPAVEYLRRLERLRGLHGETVGQLRDVDVLLAPTVAIAPPTRAAVSTPDGYRAANLLALRNTCVASYLGLCALSLPCGKDTLGLPVGLQVIATPFSEERLLATGRAVERALAAELGTPPQLA
ncbi:MAG: amidase [Polyangiales bacterium]